MPELNAVLQLGPQPPAPSKKSRGWLHACVASILSLIIPGLGQVYARRAMRGLSCGLLYFSGALLQGVFHTLLTPLGFAVFVSWNVVMGLWIIIDSARLGRKRDQLPAAGTGKGSSITTWIAAAVLMSVSIFRATDTYAGRYAPVRMFKVPSRSMCPTICEGDRMVVDPNAYRTAAPKRGDIIVFKPHFGGDPYIKRIVGTAGDVVTQGPANTILVNGQAIAKPQVCGELPPLSDNSQTIDFPETRVPNKAFFVIGDNLGNSLDSRIPEFGFVRPEMIIGKPLFLYWSHGHGRIGCEIH